MTNGVAFNINIASQKDKVKPKPQSPTYFKNFSNFSDLQNFLIFKLQPFYLHFYNSKFGDYLTFKAPKRGTGEYFKFYVEKRFKKLSKKVSNLLRVEKRGDNWGFTNALLITYTFGVEDVFKSWEFVKGFSRYWERVRKRLSRLGYDVLLGVKVVEAQGTGKAHLHILIIFRQFFAYRFDIAKGRSFVKSEGKFKQFNKIFDLGLGFFDIQPIYSKVQAVAYLTKYIAKGSQGVEPLLFKSCLSEGEVKRVLGLFYLILFRLRQFQVFGRFRKLDKSINNNSDKGWVKIRGLLLGYWLGYLKGLGLGDFAGLGIISIRGSPFLGVKIIF